MIVKSFPLIRPGVFAPEFRELHYDSNKLLVRPTRLSICAADLRYYLGIRSAAVLAQKLPMVLVHEAIGTILRVPSSSNLNVGDSVILLPCGSSASIGSNYLPGAFFRSSNADGFCQECLTLTEQEVVPISCQGDKEPYVFSELLSVCFQSLRQIYKELETSNSIAIWGDGSLGYLMSLLVKSQFPSKQVIVIGKHEEKLEKLLFVNEVETIFNRSKKKYDLLIECVGGNGAQNAINDMIDSALPNATLLLTGVSEIPPSINTRQILEKGLTLRGSTRSVLEDFILANQFLNREKIRQLVNVLDTTCCKVSNEKELKKAFDLSKNSLFKTTIEFNP